MGRSLQGFAQIITPNPVTANNMTGAATILSPVIDTWMFERMSLELVWTGTPTGTFTWEVSNQYDEHINPNPTFVAGATAVSPAFTAVAGAGGQSINGIALGTGVGQARYGRLRYVNSAGTGQLNVWLFGAGPK